SLLDYPQRLDLPTNEVIYPLKAASYSLGSARRPRCEVDITHIVGGILDSRPRRITVLSVPLYPIQLSSVFFICFYFIQNNRLRIFFSAPSYLEKLSYQF